MKEGKLNIAVDARPLAFPNSGIGRYTSALLREFARQNVEHRLFLYTDRPLPLPFSLPAHWKQRHGKVSRRALSTPFAQLFFPLWSICDRIDIFWSPRHHLPLLLPPCIRKVVTIHDVVWKRFPETMTSGGRIVESLLMPASLRAADRVIAVSQFTAKEISELFNTPQDKIDVIYEASSLPASNAIPAPNIGTPYFLFVGSSEPRKNLERLLVAYLQYRQATQSAINLVLAGSYEWGGFDVQQFLQQHELQQCVHLQRAVSDEILSQLYANATALLMPSLYEGFGLPLVEAMQWGVPIITSGDSAMAEIAGEAALFVDPYDEGDIVRALQQICENTSLHAQLAAKSKALGRQFDWRQAAHKTLKTLELA